jgi:opacity protein-like surface antigen
MTALLAMIPGVLMQTAMAQLSKKVSNAEPKFEVGGGIGGSFYQSKSLTSSVTSGDAGFENGYTGSFWIGNNMYNKLSGEFHYDYQMNDLKLSAGGTNVTFGGKSHAFHYDLLYHFTKRTAKVRPYVLAGGGLKLYQGTGTETAFQALNKLAILTKTSESKPFVTFGGGLKFAVSQHISLRLEVRDNMTPFTKKIILPVNGASASGWLNNFVPLIGISFIF